MNPAVNHALTLNPASATFFLLGFMMVSCLRLEKVRRIPDTDLCVTDGRFEVSPGVIEVTAILPNVSVSQTAKQYHDTSNCLVSSGPLRSVTLARVCPSVRSNWRFTANVPWRIAACHDRTT